MAETESTARKIKPFSERPFCIVDVETTGLNPYKHEIIEIGLIVADQKELEIIEEWEAKIKPDHPETADRQALSVNGYNALEWADASPLGEAMKKFAKKTVHGVLLGQNISFDWGFLCEAYKETGVRNRLSYHRLDLISMAWVKLRQMGIDIEMLRLSKQAEYFGVEPEPEPHRALNGARSAYEILRKIVFT